MRSRYSFRDALATSHADGTVIMLFGQSNAQSKTANLIALF
jgi:hypothetical protein